MLFLFFWKGKGWLIPVMMVLNVLVTGMIGGAIGFKDATIPMYILEFVIGLALFVPMWFVGKKLNSETQTLVDKNTGKEVTIKTQNSFFAIPMQYWSIIWPLILLLIFVVSIFSNTN